MSKSNNRRHSKSQPLLRNLLRTNTKCLARDNIASLIEFGIGFDLELTARENIYLNGALLGYTEEFIDEHFQQIVDFAELPDFVDMPMKNFSSGKVARIAFTIATITEPDTLIVDETLSVDDVFFQEKCERRTELIAFYRLLTIARSTMENSSATSILAMVLSVTFCFPARRRDT